MRVDVNGGIIRGADTVVERGDFILIEIRPDDRGVAEGVAYSIGVAALEAVVGGVRSRSD